MVKRGPIQSEIYHEMHRGEKMSDPDSQCSVRSKLRPKRGTEIQSGGLRTLICLMKTFEGINENGLEGISW